MVFAPLMDGQVDAAQRAVDEFSPAPPSSQWTHMNLVVAHAVMAKHRGPDQAAKSLAVAARELVARRPQIAADLLQGFAHIAFTHGDRERAREIVTHTRSFGMTAWYSAHPHDETLALSAKHTQRLLTEEFDRWS
jgi:hypothetical protein